MLFVQLLFALLIAKVGCECVLDGVDTSLECRAHCRKHQTCGCFWIDQKLQECHLHVIFHFPFKLTFEFRISL